MKRILSLSIIVLFAAFSMNACKSKKDNKTTNVATNVTQNENNPQNLEGRWTLVKFVANPDLENEGGKEVFLVLKPSTMEMTGNTGCNAMFGSYKADKSSLTFGGIGATEMYCEGVKTEQPLMQALDKTDSYNIIADKLILAAGAEQLAIFRRSAEE